MKRNAAFPSKYLGKADVERGPIRGVIEVIQPEDIKTEDGKETKPVLYLKDVEKGMIVNGTNWDAIAEIAAERGIADPDDSDFWIGLAIEIYNDPSVRFGQKKVGGLRVRRPSPPPRVASSGRTGEVPPRRAAPPPQRRREPLNEGDDWPMPGDEDAPHEGPSDGEIFD